MIGLYGFGDPPPQFRWDEFVSGFAPLVVQPYKFSGYWRFEHPTHSIEFNAGVADNLIRSVQFEHPLVAALGQDASCLLHPLWAGVFKAFVSWPALLHVELFNNEKAIFVTSPELLSRLPYGVQGPHREFVVSERADFDRLIAEALAADRVVSSGLLPRDGWADETEQDAEAREAFANYITGKKEALATHTWGGQPLTLRIGERGTFLGRYSDWVDRLEPDFQIVECFARRLKNPRLAVGPSNAVLEILFGGSSRTLTGEDIPGEQYRTLRALNEVLAPDFQIRLVREMVDSNTHGFLFAPTWLWAHLEGLDRKKLERKVKVIGPHDGFGWFPRFKS